MSQNPNELKSFIFEDIEFLSLITYFVPHPEQDLAKATPLQGFTLDVIKSASAYAQIATLPKSVSEFIGNDKIQLAYRIAGSPYRVFPVEVKKLQEAYDFFQPLYCCIWSANEEIAESVNKFIQKQNSPIFHASPSGAGGSIQYADVDRETIKNYVLEVSKYHLKTDPKNELIISLQEKLLEDKKFEPIQLELPNYNHLILNPNEITLKGGGFNLQDFKDPFIVSINNEPYFEAQRALVDQISNLREQIFKEKPFAQKMSPYDLILTAPSVLKHWRKIENEWRDLPKKVRQQLRSHLRQIIGRKTFAFIDNSSEVAAITNPYLVVLNNLYSDDLGAYTAALCIKASSNFVPVIRIPTSVNTLQGDLIQLENTARVAKSTPRQAAKLSRLAKQISEKLADGLPEWILNKLKNSEGVKLIADAPLEWISVDGFPLALKNEVSRIPTTPGNLFFYQTVVSPRLPFRKSDFDEILVLRAFNEQDRIKNFLTTSLETFRPQFQEGKPAIKYVDVENEGDLIKAFQDFTGVLAVFDGHGKHSVTDDIGSLQLPAGDVSPWRLRDQVRVPPIIVLSACDTHPFSASHATTASGFLAAGARTVIGTSLPVDAVSSALYAARLIFRISKFINIHFEQTNTPLRWSKLVSGLQKRQYMTEVLFAISKSAQIKLTDDLMLKLGIEIGVLIDTDKKDWHTKLLTFLAQHSPKSENEIIKLVKDEVYLTDALLHVQFGNPEQIIIINE